MKQLDIKDIIQNKIDDVFDGFESKMDKNVNRFVEILFAGSIAASFLVLFILRGIQ